MRAAPVLLPLLGLVACASAPQAPEVPASLRPPAGQVLHLEALASGVQIYDCAAKPDGSGLAWAFRAPEATLVDRAGKPLGKHYAGPTWEGLDGAKVVGEVKSRDPGPTPATAIPWLLLAAKSNAGSGGFAETKSIQRVATAGGVAPVGACTTEGQSLRSPYTATYYFYR